MNQALDDLDCEVVIVGAGVVGLAIAGVMAAAGKSVILLEREESFGRGTSSRNSEVIHAGLYYPPGSLKARLCVEGNSRLYSWCDTHGVAYRKCGKLIVGSTEEERRKLEALFAQGKANGVTQIELGGKALLKSLEPEVSGEFALWSAPTGILDTHGYMASLESEAAKEDAVLAYRCSLEEIAHNGRFVLGVKDSDGAALRVRAEVLVNSAGLQSDCIAALAGVDIDQAGYRLSYCKGEYFRVSSRHRGRLSHLVYPTPDPYGLGIHTVPDLGGGIRLGPNAFYVSRSEDYAVQETHAAEFFQRAHAYLPFLAADDLTPDQAGIRPKLQKEDESFRDFVIAEEGPRGLPGLIDLIGIESPGLTASLAIAERVRGLITDRA